jgi:hypothetical protein
VKFFTTVGPAALTRLRLAAIDSSSAARSAPIGHSRPVLRQRTWGSTSSAQNQHASTIMITIR